jgi:hypothetical protein
MGWKAWYTQCTYFRWCKLSEMDPAHKKRETEKLKALKIGEIDDSNDEWLVDMCLFDFDRVASFDLGVGGERNSKTLDVV